MENLHNYIKSAYHSNQNWMIKNHKDIYDKINEYCNNFIDMPFKQKMWHYQNKIDYNILCANKSCNNHVKFKGPWTSGYYTYCSSVCSSPDVEKKKALLNYSRIGKLTKEEKDLLNIKKQENKDKILLNKQKSIDKKLYFETLSFDEYKKLSQIKSGLYTREKYLKKTIPHIYKNIIEHTNINADFIEKAYMFINNIIERPKCPICENKLSFKNRSIGYSEYCSVSCGSKATYNQAQETFLKRNGVSHSSMLPSNIQKRLDDRISKITENIKPAVLISYKDEIVNIQCDKCNKIHSMPFGVYGQRVQVGVNWRCCITGYMNGTSNGEHEIKEYIQSIYKEKIIFNDRKQLSGKELDIYLPELNIAFEFNGIYWHSELHKEKEYHHQKYLQCKTKNIQLIQIYEDEWTDKQDIVKSRINNLLNKSNKIYARKCDVRSVDFKECKEFLNLNHIQGSVNSSINIGLYYNNELVSIMTFGKPRKGLKYKTENNTYELYRFCSKLNTSIIGGASKLFKYFILNNPDINEIFSYSSLEWPGNVYEKLGMTLDNISNFSYWYIVGKKRISRHIYNKQNLINMGYDPNKTADEILKELKIYKIYGAGNKRFVYKKENAQ